MKTFASPTTPTFSTASTPQAPAPQNRPQPSEKPLPTHSALDRKPNTVKRAPSPKKVKKNLRRLWCLMVLLMSCAILSGQTKATNAEIAFVTWNNAAQYNADDSHSESMSAGTNDAKTDAIPNAGTDPDPGIDPDPVADPSASTTVSTTAGTTPAATTSTPTNDAPHLECDFWLTDTKGEIVNALEPNSRYTVHFKFYLVGGETLKDVVVCSYCYNGGGLTEASLKITTEVEQDGTCYPAHAWRAFVTKYVTPGKMKVVEDKYATLYCGGAMNGAILTEEYLDPERGVIIGYDAPGGYIPAGKDYACEIQYGITTSELQAAGVAIPPTATDATKGTDANTIHAANTVNATGSTTSTTGDAVSPNTTTDAASSVGSANTADAADGAQVSTPHPLQNDNIVGAKVACSRSSTLPEPVPIEYTSSLGWILLPLRKVLTYIFFAMLVGTAFMFGIACGVHRQRYHDDFAHDSLTSQDDPEGVPAEPPAHSVPATPAAPPSPIELLDAAPPSDSLDPSASAIPHDEDDDHT